jgi:hypothetical protein
LLDAAVHYESEGHGLGGKFLDDVQAMLVRIEENPLSRELGKGSLGRRFEGRS